MPTGKPPELTSLGKVVPKPKTRHYIDIRYRIKKGNACHDYPIGVGKGIPEEYVPLVERKRRWEAAYNLLAGKAPDAFAKYAKALDLIEFRFEDDTVDPTHIDHKREMKGVDFDMTAKDRYNDEVRRYRNELIEECRVLPDRIEMDQEPELLFKLEEIVTKLVRNTYYGTVKSQKLAEAALPVVVWLCNRRGFPEEFHCILHKRITEMCWMSLALKGKFYRARGVEVLYHNMRISEDSKRLSCWACYAMAMISTGSPEIIKEARKMRSIDELLCELSFEYYWYDWPANFAMILQAIIFGPHTVTPAEEYFEFL